MFVRRKILWTSEKKINRNHNSNDTIVQSIDPNNSNYCVTNPNQNSMDPQGGESYDQFLECYHRLEHATNSTRTTMTFGSSSSSSLHPITSFTFTSIGIGCLGIYVLSIDSHSSLTASIEFQRQLNLCCWLPWNTKDVRSALSLGRLRPVGWLQLEPDIQRWYC